MTSTASIVASFGGFPGYYDYAYYDGCLRREWGPYGWSFVNICY